MPILTADCGGFRPYVRFRWWLLRRAFSRPDDSSRRQRVMQNSRIRKDQVISMDHHPDPHVFLDIVRPGLQEADAARLARDVAQHWTPAQISSLLVHDEPDLRRVAAVVLGLVGDRSVIGALAKALHDADEQVNQMAEHGLWSIWFRTGDCKAAKHFRQGVALIGSENYEQSLEHFGCALRIDPNYSEAYNQCAIAHFFLEQWEQSLAYCKRVIQHVPMHFGAISGMGHCHLHLGQLEEALACYKRSLEINPRMPAIADAVERLKQQIHDSNDSSGMFSWDAIKV